MGKQFHTGPERRVPKHRVLGFSRLQCREGTLVVIAVYVRVEDHSKSRHNGAGEARLMSLGWERITSAHSHRAQIRANELED